MSVAALPVGGALLENAALIVGFMAGAIAVGAFVGRAFAVIRGQDDTRVQMATILGGLSGLGLALVILGLDQVAN